MIFLLITIMNKHNKIIITIYNNKTHQAWYKAIQKRNNFLQHDNILQSLDFFTFVTSAKYPFRDKLNIVKYARLVLMGLIIIVYGLENVLGRKICGSLNSFCALCLLLLSMHLFCQYKAQEYKKYRDLLFFLTFLIIILCSFFPISF